MKASQPGEVARQLIEAPLHELEIRTIRQPAPGCVEHLPGAIDQGHSHGRRFPEQLIGQDAIATPEVANAHRMPTGPRDKGAEKRAQDVEEVEPIQDVMIRVFDVLPRERGIRPAGLIKVAHDFFTFARFVRPLPRKRFTAFK